MCIAQIEIVVPCIFKGNVRSSTAKSQTQISQRTESSESKGNNSLQELALIHMIMDVNRKQLAIYNEGSHSRTTTRRYTFTWNICIIIKSYFHFTFSL